MPHSVPATEGELASAAIADCPRIAHHGQRADAWGPFGVFDACSTFQYACGANASGYCGALGGLCRPHVTTLAATVVSY